MVRIISGKDELLISKPIIQELLDVLATKFSHDREQLAHLAVFLSELGESVRPRRTLRVLSDEADNRILECAKAGNADAIVTGDQAMLKLGEYENIRLMTLRDYLQLR